jgi:hypothetical protein
MVLSMKETKKATKKTAKKVAAKKVAKKPLFPNAPDANKIYTARRKRTPEEIAEERCERKLKQVRMLYSDSDTQDHMWGPSGNADMSWALVTLFGRTPESAKRRSEFETEYDEKSRSDFFEWVKKTVKSKKFRWFALLGWPVWFVPVSAIVYGIYLFITKIIWFIGQVVSEFQAL